ncbi:MAG: ATP-binding cassette domain-containing protein [Propionibacteriaceae bacterium]|jgi:zinc transport system ATP-binding protein|nr:ATP-binding cassette domain-containing protein [Propionibacteriaceae bacterium]
MITPLRINDLSVTLGNTAVLHGVDLVVSPGETVALLGANGSGKTTLLRAALGLVPHTSGNVQLFDVPLNRFRDWQQVGYVPQHGSMNVLKATVLETVRSGRIARQGFFHHPTTADREAVDKALQIVRMNDLAHCELADLSSGQRQRAMVARALAGEPELLLLDEPLAGLDMRSQEALAAILAELKTTGLTSCVVLHELGSFEPLLDRSVVLREGRVIYSGKLAGDTHV